MERFECKASFFYENCMAEKPFLIRLMITVNENRTWKCLKFQEKLSMKDEIIHSAYITSNNTGSISSIRCALILIFDMIYFNEIVEILSTEKHTHTQHILSTATHRRCLLVYDDNNNNKFNILIDWNIFARNGLPTWLWWCYGPIRINKMLKIKCPDVDFFALTVMYILLIKMVFLWSPSNDGEANQ